MPRPGISGTVTSASGTGLGGGTVRIFNGTTLIKITRDGVVHIGPRDAIFAPMDGVVTGRGIDSFTGLPYVSLGNASTGVFAK